MLFYYVQIKDRHDPGVNIREKARVASVNEAELVLLHYNCFSIIIAVYSVV